MVDEWQKLKDMKCWTINSVAEYECIKKQAKADGRTMHFGCIFPILTLKGSELKDPKLQKWKGRVVFQGNNVKDQNNNVAVYQEMSSCGSLMIAGKLIDAIGCLPVYIAMQADAQQAYTQSELGGYETWIFLPRDQWPPSWAKFRNPVVPLRLALYGHPLSGAFWEKHCTAQLRSIGFEPIPNFTDAGPPPSLTPPSWVSADCQLLPVIAGYCRLLLFIAGGFRWVTCWSHSMPRVHIHAFFSHLPRRAAAVLVRGTGCTHYRSRGTQPPPPPPPLIVHSSFAPCRCL